MNFLFLSPHAVFACPLPQGTRSVRGTSAVPASRDIGFTNRSLYEERLGLVELAPKNPTNAHGSLPVLVPISLQELSANDLPAKVASSVSWHDHQKLIEMCPETLRRMPRVRRSSLLCDSVRVTVLSGC